MNYVPGTNVETERVQSHNYIIRTKTNTVKE